MLIEQRTYTLDPGKMRQYLATYEKEGLEIQKTILGHWLGCMVTEIGPLNQVIHLWGFSSFEDRLARRARLMADPTWQGYLAKVAGLTVHQENRILLPAAFWEPPAKPQA